MTGPQLDSGLLLLAGALVLGIVFLGLRRSPKVAMLAWLFVICFVPVWIGQNFGPYFPAFTIIGLLAAASLLPTASRVRWSVVDLAFVAVAVIVVIEYVVNVTTLSATFDLITAWGAAFLLGRIITSVLDPRWVYGAVGVFFSVVALIALLEFATSFNFFTSYLVAGNSNYAAWGPLQPRGDITRAEGAFGHSIALGSSLGVAVAMTMGSRFGPLVKTGMLALMAAGAVVSFSRTGMVTAAFAIVLACLFLREPLSRQYRRTVLVLVLIGGGIVFASIRDVFLDSGGESQLSASYRSELLQLISYIQPFGLASNFSISTTREVTIGEFRSIDNALLLFGLTYGWVPAALILLLVPVAIVYLLRGRATPAVVAVVAQFPALVTVALITQYAAVLWFAVGMAVSTQVMANDSLAAPRRSPRPASRTRTPAVAGRRAASEDAPA